jgi:hypothetical protein
VAPLTTGLTAKPKIKSKAEIRSITMIFFIYTFAFPLSFSNKAHYHLCKHAKI